MYSETITTRYTVIGFVLALAVLPMAFYGCGPEWARWDAAQALHYYSIGEVDEALFQLRDAIQKSPRDPVLKLTLGERLLEIKEPEEALDLANQVLDMYPGTVDATLLKCEALQTTGDFEKALDVWLKFDQTLDAKQRNASTLNQLAYFRALANKDLHLAKRDILTATEATNRGLTWQGLQGLTLQTKATVAATLVARCCNAHEETLELLTSQVAESQALVKATSAQLLADIYADIEHSFPVHEAASQVELRQTLRNLETREAVLLSCRAIVYQDLGDQLNSQVDRLSVRDLGFDCTQILKSLPDDQLAVMYLSQLSAFLDTRSFVNSLLPWNASGHSDERGVASNFATSIRDVDIAILCASIDLRSFDYAVRNSMELLENRSIAKKTRTKTLAVLHNHRLGILKRAGMEQRAEKEIETIESLGFTPGPELF